MPQAKVAEKEYIPGQQTQEADEGNLLNFDLADFFRVEYLSLLDSSEPHLAKYTPEPTVAIGSDKESGNPPVPTTIVEQQTLSKSLFTPLPLKRKIIYVSERVNLKRAPKKEWYNVFVLNNAALPDSKKKKN